jgi:hypothetical protein
MASRSAMKKSLPYSMSGRLIWSALGPVALPQSLGWPCEGRETTFGCIFESGIVLDFALKRLACFAMNLLRRIRTSGFR